MSKDNFNRAIWMDMSQSAKWYRAGVLGGLLLGLLGLANPLSAEPRLTGTYLGGFYSNSDQNFESPGNPTFSRSRGHLKLKLGTALNEYIDVEGQLGATSDSGSDEGIVTYGGYLRFYKDFDGRKYRAYGIAGFSGTEDLNDITDLSESGLSYGFGFEIFGSKDLSIGIELMRLYDTSFQTGELSSDLLGIGVTYYFMEEGSVFDRNRDKIDSIRY